MNDSLAHQEEIREELLGGEFVMMSPAALNHVLIAGNIYHIFAGYLHGKECTPIADGALVFLTEQEHFIPDFMVVCDRNKIGADGIHGAPDLVVEILSPSTAQNDRRHKKEVYERCGVKEYWIVSPGDRTVEQYLLREGKFILNQTYADYPDWMLRQMTPEAQAAVVKAFQCSLYDDLIISLGDVFARVP